MDEVKKPGPEDQVFNIRIKIGPFSTIPVGAKPQKVKHVG